MSRRRILFDQGETVDANQVDVAEIMLETFIIRSCSNEGVLLEVPEEWCDVVHRDAIDGQDGELRKATAPRMAARAAADIAWQSSSLPTHDKVSVRSLFNGKAIRVVPL